LEEDSHCAGKTTDSLLSLEIRQSYDARN